MATTAISPSPTILPKCKMFRPEIVSAAATVVPTGQFGTGFNAGSTDPAHLEFSAFLDAASAARRSAATLFVDFATAFASLLRLLCVPADAGDEQWLAALAAAGFSQDEVKCTYDDAASQLCLLGPRRLVGAHAANRCGFASDDVVYHGRVATRGLNVPWQPSWYVAGRCYVHRRGRARC